MSERNIVRVQSYWYNELDCLGRGAFGAVYKGHSEQDANQLFAIKLIVKGLVPLDLIKQEIQILQELSAPDVSSQNLVKLWNYIEEEDRLYLVMEYCNGGDLDHYLKENRKMNELSLKIFLQQIGSAMRILYEHGVIHRDLKPANILLSYKGTREISNITFKLADFGIGKFLEIGKSTESFAGTPVFMAPEVFHRDGKYDYKVDLWSLGAIVFKCFTGTLYSAFDKKPISLPVDVNPDLNDLITRLLCYNPAERISFIDFYNHPFIEMPEKMKTKEKKTKVTKTTRDVSPTGCFPCRRRQRNSAKEDDRPQCTVPPVVRFHDPIQAAPAMLKRDDIQVQNSNVYGVAYLESRIHVLCRSPNVLIQYSHLSSFFRIKEIDISEQIKLPQDVAACSVSKCLYVTDIGTSSIWKIEVGFLPKVTKWVSNISEPHTVSVNTTNGHVVTFEGKSKELAVYDKNAELMHRIRLPSDIKFPQHAIETSNGNFIVSFGDPNGKKTQGICKISNTGKILNRYKEKAEKLNHPTHLAFGAEDKIFVADKGNSRVVLLNSDLELEQILPNEANVRIENPFRLCYTPNKELLINHSVNTISLMASS